MYVFVYFTKEEVKVYVFNESCLTTQLKIKTVIKTKGKFIGNSKKCKMNCIVSKILSFQNLHVCFKPNHIIYNKSSKN